MLGKYNISNTLQHEYTIKFLKGSIDMAKFLILWEMNLHAMPADPSQQTAILARLGTMTKQALDSGQVKDWGIFAGGNAGYSISDETSIDTLTRVFKFNPYVKFQVNPVLGIADVMQIMQSMPK